MTTRETVKAYQQKLAEHVDAHSRAAARLERARLRRDEMLAAQDVLVADARSAVDRAVVDMALELGPELAATLAGLEPGEVRKMIKSLAVEGEAAVPGPATATTVTGR